MFKRSQSNGPPQATEVTMYTLSTCPWCRRAKKYFSDHEVPYACTDVDAVGDDERHEIAEKIMELCGSLQYPVVIINGEPIQGYDPDGYSYRLRDLGWDV